MKAYGIDAMRNAGHKYAEDDVYTKGYFHGGKKHQISRRRKHQRIYKKIQRAYHKRLISSELQNYTG